MRQIDADALLEELEKMRFPGAPYVDAGVEIAIGKVCEATTIEALPPAQPDVPDTNVGDMVSRQAAVDALDQIFDRCEEIEAHLPEGDPDRTGYKMYPDYMTVWKYLHQLPSAQPEQRYTEEELRVFQHGISLSLLSKRSAQRWQYDEDTATEIKFLERLYEKVGADMRGEQDE